MRFTTALFIFILSACIQMQSSLAAQIKAVKGKKVLVDMQTDTFKAGDVLKIENAAGKTVGLTKLTKVKGTLAEGLLKGKAEKGFVAKLRPPKAKKAAAAAVEAPSENSEDNAPEESDKMYWGVIGGFNSTSAEVKLPISGDVVDLKGSGFSLKGLFDYELFPWLSLRGLGGLEQFNVGGENNAECGTECTAEINYFAFDLWARFILGSGSFRTWVGGGFDLMFPIGKKSTALDEESITNTSIFGIGGGFDWYLSNTTFIPIQFEYNLYPSSEDVKANSIAIRAGYGMAF